MSALGQLVTGFGHRALVPLTGRGHMDESALAVTRHAPLLPICSLVAPGRGLLTATETDGYAHTLGVTGRTIVLTITWPLRGPA